MKIVLVGAGGMAMSHVQAYQLLGVKDICAVVDPVLENAKRLRNHSARISTQPWRRCWKKKIPISQISARRLFFISNMR